MTVLRFFEEIDAAQKGRTPAEREAFRALVAPEAVASLCQGTGSHDATGILRQTHQAADPRLAKRCLRALIRVYRGSGEAGFERLMDYGLDRTPRLRDHTPHLLGACASGRRLPEVDAELLHALEHPSPARRKGAFRGASLAWRGLRDADLARAIERALRPEDDFVTRLEALDCLGAVHAGNGTRALLARMDALLAERDRLRALDAGRNPYLAYAHVGRDSAAEPHVETLLYRLAENARGASRRNARIRRAVLECFLVLGEGKGMAAAAPVWGALEDPMRSVRVEALWGAPRLWRGAFEADDEDALEAALLRGGMWTRAAAALCLGEFGGDSAWRVLVGARDRVETLAGRCAALARARLELDGIGPELGAGALEWLEARERRAELIVAAGLAYVGTADARATELLRAASQRRPKRAALGALGALGAVHRGAGPRAAFEAFRGLEGAGGGERSAALAEGFALASTGRAAWLDSGAGRVVAYGLPWALRWA